MGLRRRSLVGSRMGLLSERSDGSTNGGLLGTSEMTTNGV